MYPTSQLAPQMNAVPYSGTIGQAPAPTGIASAVEELKKEVYCALDRTATLRSTLGISAPETGGNKASEPGSLVEVIRMLTRYLSNANSDLGDVLQHLNS